MIKSTLGKKSKDSKSMSLQHWMQLQHNIPWKVFTRESSNEDKSPEKYNHQLSFQGNEARAVYEDVIYQTNSAAGKIRYLKSSMVEIRSICNSVINLTSINRESKKVAVHQDSITKITTNILLKAVERKDLHFLQNHMTSENVNISDDFGWTPLMSAAYCGHLEIVQFLLTLGAKKNIRDRSGLTAAQLALKKNYLNIVALLKKESLTCNNQLSINIPKINNTSALSTRSISVEYPVENENVHITDQKLQVQKTKFYCEMCKEIFQETTPEKHESSILHIFNIKPKLKHTIYGISKQNKGYKMLVNSGWDEEAGLGPSGKGVKYPIKMCLKMDHKGLGQLENEYKLTHCKSSDMTVNSAKLPKQKTLKKRDRERLLHKETRKERALRIALS